jgi:DNA-binding CsgD family transcriptional regulator
VPAGLYGSRHRVLGDALSEAELEVIACLLEGKSFAEIGSDLGLRVRTIKDTMRRIAYKIVPDYDPQKHLLRIAVASVAARAQAISPIVAEVLQI